jgi:transposase
MSVDHAVPAGPAPTGGIDWANDNHAICVVDNDGGAVQRLTVAHTAAGLRRMTDLLARHGVDAVAIERPHGRSLMPCSVPA